MLKSFLERIIIMGIFGGSSEEINNQKQIDATGNINNNVIIQEAHDVHEQLKLNEKVVNLMYAMCALEIIKFGMYIYCKFIRKMKKKYSGNSRN